MEVSGQSKAHVADELKGDELLQAVVSLIDLPDQHWVSQQVHEVVEASGQPQEELTLEQLRHAVAQYLEASQEAFFLLCDESELSAGAS